MDWNIILEILPDLLPWLLLLSFTCLIAFLFYLWGKQTGVSKGKEQISKKTRLIESQRDKLQSELTAVNLKLEQYINFLVRIPDAVKNINSALSFDELVTSTIRLTKEMIDTNAVEIYIKDLKSGNLKLVAAFGTNRGQSIELKPGEDVVGNAAELLILVSRDSLKPSRNTAADKFIEMAAPIAFRGSLIGVIGIGKIKRRMENEKRLLSMIADLFAVAYRNLESLDSVKEEAITDALTGLFNRRYFFEAAHSELRKTESYNSTLSVFIFDIDNFKHYNDTNGHPQGDILLKELALLVKKNSRSTNIVARYGGEEFIVLLKDNDKNGVMTYAENIRKMIETHPFQHREKQPLGFVSISGGVVAYPVDGDTIEKLIKNADSALYSAKESGRNRVIAYQS
ncbi:MAG: diguanylate cyclase [Nitrospirae bacterium]|nr:diguanylate cyclase [Nitrospirota bacterium]